MKGLARHNPVALVFLVVTLGFSLRVHGQTSFQNLGFESANSLPNPPSGQAQFVPIANALPGWTGYVGSSQTAQAIFNGVSLGAPLVSLIGPDSGFYTNDLIGGNYSATIDAGSDGVHYISAGLGQMGTIPGFAKSLLFDAGGAVSGDLTVTFGGQLLSYYPEGSGRNYEVYGVDVSSFAGQTGELLFTENSTGVDATAIAILDNISFSPDPIPEPKAWVILLCGAGAAPVYLRRKNFNRS